ncbi:MAG: DUF262 domain-containing protein [Synergistaceae bacterium]|nr:DUF262 domain-containing protein [Synergistaceae bacterium]
MKIELHEIKISEVFNGYEDNDENGVVAYGGKLNVRPAYQREFIYKDKQRADVIRSVRSGFPLNSIYWAKSEDGYEMMDGQQRTISICQFLSGDFSVDYMIFDNFTKEEKEQFLNYKINVYICDGTDREKLDWFRIINIAGEKLTAQEMRNAIYTGTWLADAKKFFSKRSCRADTIAHNYMNGSPIRQDYLETVISWIAERDGVKDIEEYMARHQHDSNANELWQYFQDVIKWTKENFTNYRKEMKGLSWGIFYDHHKDEKFNPSELEEKIKKLMADDDVTKKSGIYEYLLDGQEKHLSIRTFTDTQKRTQYEKQKGICPKCGKHYSFSDMEGDHITPWSKGGKTLPENLQMLCKNCNRKKSGS